MEGAPQNKNRIESQDEERAKELLQYKEMLERVRKNEYDYFASHSCGQLLKITGSYDDQDEEDIEDIKFSYDELGTSKEELWRLSDKHSALRTLRDVREMKERTDSIISTTGIGGISGGDAERIKATLIQLEMIDRDLSNAVLQREDIGLLPNEVEALQAYSNLGAAISSLKQYRYPGGILPWDRDRYGEPTMIKQYCKDAGVTLEDIGTTEQEIALLAEKDAKEKKSFDEYKKSKDEGAKPID